MDGERIEVIARRLIEAQDRASTLDPITASEPGFDVDAAYQVLFEVHALRAVQGWEPVGRKIGFTNRTIWDRYGVDRPMWAHVWRHTVHHVDGDTAHLAVDGFVQPRVEPEVVFGLRAPVPLDSDALAVLGSVEWIAAAFEIVQCPFPGWRFEAADCTAAYGLHAALVVGTPTLLDQAARDRTAAELERFELVLHRGAPEVARGRGGDVLGSPALALQHLARVVAGQPHARELGAGEVVTTGTVTDAQPTGPGDRWRADYGSLGLASFELTIR